MNALKLQRKYPQFTGEQIQELVRGFNKIDLDDKGSVDQQAVIKACQVSEKSSYDEIRAALKEVNLDSTGRVELEDYVELVSKIRSGSSKGTLEVSKAKIKVGGANANISHTINDDERTEFTRHINGVLAGDADIGARLPFPTDTFEMFDQCKDGLVLSKLINDAVPDTIDERVLNKSKGSKQLNNFTMTENNNIVINSAKSLGLSVVNIGAQDLMEGREHLILGLIWQIIRRGLLSKIDIKLHPELYRLLEEDETLEQFLRLPPEQILLRWFNYHLKAAGWHRKVHNFSSDVADGENYTVLLNQLKPEICSRAPLQTKDLHQRAEQVLQNADKIECRKYLTASSMVAGNPKLNLAFVANLFNTHPGLDPLEEREKPVIEEFDAEGEREARVFTLWLNSLDIDPAVNNLFEDVKDGVVLLQAYDKITPGSVNWRAANKKPAGEGREMSRFKQVENTNYAVTLGLQNRFSLVGIQGADITDGHRLSILSIGWQLMRKDLTETLKRLGSKMGGDITDSQIIKWANDKAGGKSKIRNFGDPCLRSGRFFLDVLSGMRSEYVDYDIVTDGRSDEDAHSNARLAISIARKMGATIFLLPEDIVAVRSKLCWTFVASLMATSMQLGH
ncbi:fimbrin [Savitreella phatthalungensis]